MKKENGYTLKARLRSFGHALNGMLEFFKREVNAQIHLLATVVCVSAGWYFEISASDWLWVASAIAAVITVEIINTAIEELVDLVHPEQHPKAGFVKDLAASAVLITAFYALIVGVAIFYDPITSLFGSEF
ncbi:MAG: diacylglycerol kinase family protein [Salibacteraceae bacterium]